MRNRRRLSLAAGSCGALVVLLSGLWLHAQQADARPLSSLLPPGALLYLEAKDFGSLLKQWNASAEKKQWLMSSNFGVLQRSRLLLRLTEAQDQFAAVSGVAPGMDLLNQVAGQRSAFAFYDLSSLDFVYLTQRSDSSDQTNDLLRGRPQYQPRRVSGIPFYVKIDAQTNRTVCFASYGRWFAVATNEDRLAQSLALIAAAQAPSLATESWFQEATRLASAQGELRLVYHLEALLKTPQFRTYWLQRNASELAAYTAGIADLNQSGGGFEEARALLRREALPTPPHGDLSAVLQHIPASTSLYRAWAEPERTRLAEVLQQVIFSNAADNPANGRTAPGMNLNSPEAGSLSGFETLIDQPPPASAQAVSAEPLVDQIMQMKPDALLHVQATQIASDQVWVMPASAAVVAVQQPDANALQNAVAKVTDIVETGRLDPLRVSIEGNLVILSRLDLTRTVPAPQVDPAATYFAAFDKAREWPRYRKLFDMVDRSATNPGMASAEQTPPFFSGNLLSLGDALSRFSSASITGRAEPNELRETIRYRFGQP